MKLIEIKKIVGEIKLLSGLHIGGNKDTIEIGGIDNPVIKNHLNGEPYIPGSSLKGKLRSLLEYFFNKVELDGRYAGAVWGSNPHPEIPYEDNDPILRIFGTTQKDYKGGPTRLTIRDSYLISNWKDKVLNRGLLLTEEKIEVSIDRIKGSASKSAGGPRHVERVPAGAVFNLEMSYKIFDMGDEGKTDKANLNHLFKAMKLLEQDALGGSGSRGYGRIRFNELKLDDESIQEQFDGIDVHSEVRIVA